MHTYIHTYIQIHAYIDYYTSIFVAGLNALMREG